jgi:hypothetical protein
MNSPRVSICLPNLNNRPFLEERLSTIFDQSLTDWELIIYDNFSEDGAWELFQEAAGRDARIRIAQAPRQGMYANWNNCIRAACGDYVYIATSDDNMAPDCLEKLVEALDTNPECDLAHCNLRMFDSKGEEVSSRWWNEASLFARSSGDLLRQRHTRRAPFDGLLHLSGDTVYTSITQLLIRRSLFSRMGLFEPRWGSLGDFNWNMRAGLVANTVHVPDTWGGWRQHEAQATASAHFGSDHHVAKMDEMVDHAIAAVGDLLDSPIKRALVRRWGPRMRGMRHLELAMQTLPSRFSRRMYLASQLAAGTWAAWWQLGSRLNFHPTFLECQAELMTRWLEKEGLGPVLLPAKAKEYCASC